MCVPILNIILLFVWSFGSSANLNKKNFARASLILGAIGLILSIVFGAALSSIIGELLGGMGGSIQVLGMYERFQWVNLPGYGFDGVIVSILAKKNPLLVPVAAFFLAYLRIGSDIMSSSTDVTNELISIIQSIIILFVSAKVFLDAYRQKMVVKEVTSHE
mgnify:CR=1 FL=1